MASCTNDELVPMTPQDAATGRPTVDNVTLNFGQTGAETRLGYNKDGYFWHASDTIGALLMDEFKGAGDWYSKYALVDYIHTSFPFTYSNGVWGCNTKMLEGNYFFAYPWEDYDGNRKVMHSMLKQEQDGVKGEVVAKSLAANQFFVGYSQIKAGTQSAEALDEVRMTPILGAIQLRITNTGTQAYHINKIVLQGVGLSSAVTIDPTAFEVYNYVGDADHASYVEMTQEEKDASLAAVVKNAASDPSVQLTINGTESERLLAPNAASVAYALIMANPVEVVSTLNMSIYTDEGVLTGVDLTEVNDKKEQYGYVTKSAVAEIGPDVTNTIEIQVDDNAFIAPKEMTVYNAEDLMQLIKWNNAVSGKRAFTANVDGNVTLTAEAAEILKKNANLTMTVNAANTEDTLSIATDVLSFNSDKTSATLNINTPVIANCDIAAGKNMTLPASLTIAEGYKMTVSADLITGITITVYGTMDVQKEVTVANGSINVYGAMTVAETAEVKSAVNVQKEGTLTNGGYMNSVKNEGTLNLTATGLLVGGSNVNKGLIIPTAGSSMNVNNKEGRIQYVKDATINADAGGRIFDKITSSKSINKDSYKVDDKVLVNSIEVCKGIKVTVNGDGARFEEIVLNEDAELTVENKKTLNVDFLETAKANEESPIKVYTKGGTIQVKEITVNENVTLVNTATIIATGASKGAAGFFNNGIVQNSGTVQANYWNALNNPSTWKYNEATEYTGDNESSVHTDSPEEAKGKATVAAIRKAIPEFVNAWIKNSGCPNIKIMTWADFTNTDSSKGTLAGVAIANTIDFGATSGWCADAKTAWDKVFVDRKLDKQSIEEVFTKGYSYTVNDCNDHKGTTYPTSFHEVIATAVKNYKSTGEAELKAALANASNAKPETRWFGASIFAQKENVAQKDIVDGSDKNMYTAWGEYMKKFDAAKLTNAAAWTRNELRDAKNNKDESLYPGNAVSYIPAYSYVELYQPSTQKAVEYITMALKMYNEESVRNVVSVLPYKTVNTMTFATLRAFMVAVYDQAQKDGNGYDFKQATKDLNEDVLSTIDSWNFTDAQIDAVYDFVDYTLSGTGSY